MRNLNLPVFAHMFSITVAASEQHSDFTRGQFNRTTATGRMVVQ